MYSLVCKGLSNDDVGVARGAPYFRRYGQELVSKPAISLKKRWGGLPTVEQNPLGFSFFALPLHCGFPSQKKTLQPERLRPKRNRGGTVASNQP